MTAVAIISLLQSKAKGLPEKTAELALNQISHEEKLVDRIPIDAELKAQKAKNYLSLQNIIIRKLKEQINLRDQILDSCKNSDSSILPKNDINDCPSEIQLPLIDMKKNASFDNRTISQQISEKKRNGNFDKNNQYTYKDQNRSIN